MTLDELRTRYQAAYATMQRAEREARRAGRLTLAVLDVPVKAICG